MWRADMASRLGFWERGVIVWALALPIRAASGQKGGRGGIMVRGHGGRRQQWRGVARLGRHGGATDCGRGVHPCALTQRLGNGQQ
jgi:hypothetical protein